MDPITLSAILPAVATAAGSALDYAGSRLAAKEQMAFQREMSNTAYQRSVADMQKAGLNPAMMYTGSGGASSSPVGSNVQKSDFGDTFSKSVNSALASRRLNAELESIKVNNERTRADTALTLANTQNAIIERQGLVLRNAATAQDVRSRIYGNVKEAREADFYDSTLGEVFSKISPYLSMLSPFSAKSVNKREYHHHDNRSIKF